MNRRLLVALAVVSLAGTASASAEVLLTGFGGVAFSGATERSRGTYGGSIGFLGSVVGFETEFATTPDFFGSSSESGAFTDNDVVTLMGNFIAQLLLVYFTAGILKDPSGTGQVMASRPLGAAYRISSTSGLSAPIIGIAVVVGVAMWVLVNRTAFGVLSSLAGRNPIMIVWQGARLSRLGLAGFVLSGALAGLAGTIEVLGPNGRLVSGFLPTHGFTAILIALVASLSIVGTAVVSLFFGGLAAAGLYLPVLVGLPAAAIDIINAAIALFITARTWPGLDRFFRRRTAAAGGV